MRYQIGDKVWYATFASCEAWVTCPDCGGTGQITCILFDGTQHSVECEGCRRGFNPPTGKVSYYKCSPFARPVEITGVELSQGAVRYHTSGSYGTDEADLWPTYEEAMARGAEIGARYEAEEKARVLQKEKPNRKWSWHVHYHRSCIRRAKKDLEYHESKLAVAKLKAKEPAE